MVDRVKKLLEIEHLTPSQFADEIKLQRSSLSHVLSGRNKPSLDFVMKIKERFSEVNLEWLIFGKGHMFAIKQDDEISISKVVLPEDIIDDTQQAINFNIEEKDNLAAIPAPVSLRDSNIASKSTKSIPGKAVKVMLFYNDGTFEEYISKK